MRNAIEEAGEGVGFSLKRNSGRSSNRRDGSPTEVTDLDFADDIALLSDNMVDAQRLLSAVEHWALAVGLRINKKKTEYMRLGDFSTCTHPPLRVLAGEIAEVDDFKYLGCWMADSAKDFSVRRALAFKAADKLWRVWKSFLPEALKVRFFRACIEPIRLYGSRRGHSQSTSPNVSTAATPGYFEKPRAGRSATGKRMSNSTAIYQRSQTLS